MLSAVWPASHHLGACCVAACPGDPYSRPSSALRLHGLRCVRTDPGQSAMHRDLRHLRHQRHPRLTTDAMRCRLMLLVSRQ